VPGAPSAGAGKDRPVAPTPVKRQARVSSTLAKRTQQDTQERAPRELPAEGEEARTVTPAAELPLVSVLAVSASREHEEEEAHTVTPAAVQPLVSVSATHQRKTVPWPPRSRQCPSHRAPR